jgi:hypothetical protein
MVSSFSGETEIIHGVWRTVCPHWYKQNIAGTNLFTFVIHPSTSIRENTLSFQHIFLIGSVVASCDNYADEIIMSGRVLTGFASERERFGGDTKPLHHEKAPPLPLYKTRDVALRCFETETLNEKRI